MPGGASPGLLRRRYSVPETIMRKYCLAQQRSDSDSPCVSPASASPAPCGACGGRGGGGHEREVMRKSALMRRLWGRAPASRSLHGSSAELRRSPAGSGWASPKRQRLEWPSPLSPPCSDCTFASHRARSPASRGDPALPETAPARPDVFTRYSELVNDSAPAVHPLSASSGTPTTSPPTTQEVRTAAAPVFDEPKLEVPPKRPTRIDVEVDRYSSLPYVPPTAETTPTPPYEVLEIVVSETSDASRAPPSPTPSPARTPSKGGRNINIDEYVSNILVESLNSLTEQLEGVTGGTGAERVSVVEKEIKVRLQHAGVNTVVHLSPTSNHQIIFGNAELLHRDRPPPPPPEPPSPPRSPPLEGVNRAVLQQIQKLFHDELHRLDPGVAYPGEPTLAQIEVSNVDAFLDRLGDEEWLHPGAPHSASMEAHASSSEPEPCPSLVDSLDDPASPRVPPSAAAPLGRLARSAVDVLDLPPEAAPEPSPPSPRDRVEAFFIGITDDDGSAGRGGAVAEHMPDTIRERLLRRQRKRESRMESRRGRGRARGRARDAERDAQAVLGALVDELIAKIAHDEHTYLRMKRAHSPPGVRGRLALRRRAPPAPAPPAAPRRLYQKSEIHDGDKCIEILEILEYVDDSQNSSETTNSDERPSGRVRRSRIPVPVYERIRRTRVGRASRRSPPPAPSPTSPPPAPPPARRASVPPPSSPRARAGSLRFRRVFDVIPEERAPDDRRVSAPNLATAVPALAPPPAAPPALAAPAPSPPRATRSAATSPPAPQRASRSTMTSPRRSPPRAPAAGVPPRVAAGIALACTACR